MAGIAFLAWSTAAVAQGSPKCSEHGATAATAEAPAACTHETLAEYAARAAWLRDHALTTGRLDYADVVRSAYPAGSITAEVLAAKVAWRGSLRARGAFMLLADYDLTEVDAAVETLQARSDPALKSTLVAQYEAINHWIGLAPAASDFCAFHEAGHALQRDALRARGLHSASHATEDRFQDMLESGRASATTVARLRYLSSQDEFEVRLQDLNRFHAIGVAGRPIVSPLDSVRALRALGVPVSYEEARQAFAAGGETLAEPTFAELRKTTPEAPAATTRLFEDARELRLLRRLALRVDPGYWPHLLAKIVFEAPAHL